MSYRKTENKFTKSVGGSLKSLVGQSGRTYFILEHKTSSSKYKAGDSLTFTSDYVELGRSPKCAMSFSEADGTVSRRHAAIINENNKYLIRNLSGLNPTLVNGRPVANEWYLENGDEIQLSMEGPRLGFLAPDGNFVGSLPLGTRIKAVGREAIRPYRNAVIALAIILICSVSALSFFWYQDHQELKTVELKLDEQIKITNATADSIKMIVAENEEVQEKLKSEVSKWKGRAYKPPAKNRANNKGNAPNTNSGNANAQKLIKEYFDDVYFVAAIELIVSLPGGEKETLSDFQWSGTGFLLADGRFITARHVAEPWFYLSEDNEAMTLLNLVINNGGTVEVNFKAVSPNGEILKFSNRDMDVDRSKDEKMKVENEDGDQMVISNADFDNGTDWAVLRTQKTGKILFDNDLSQNLSFGQELYFLGYPFGVKLQQIGSSVQPIFSESTVGRDKLVNNMISVSDRNFDQGNSGGPGFVIKDEKMYAIGIVSTGIGTLGNLVPISATR